jgi:hypothetical protein
VFEFANGKEKAPEQNALSVFTTRNSDEYQKCTAVAGNYLAISNSLTPGTVWVFGVDALTKGAKFSKTFKAAVNDIGISPSGEKLAVATNDTLYILESKSGKIQNEIPVGQNLKFSKVRFVSDNALVCAVNAGVTVGWWLRQYTAKGKLVQDKKIMSSGSVVALDAGSKYVVVGSSANCEIFVVSVANLSVVGRFTDAHKVAVTSIALNPAENRVASTSVSGTVHVIDIPDGGFSSGGFKSYVWALLSVALIAVIAVLIQFTVIKRQVIDDLLSSSKDYFRSPPKNEIFSSVEILSSTVAPVSPEAQDDILSAEVPPTTAESALHTPASEKTAPEDSESNSDTQTRSVDPVYVKLYEQMESVVGDAVDFILQNRDSPEDSLSPKERAAKHAPKPREAPVSVKTPESLRMTVVGEAAEKPLDEMRASTSSFIGKQVSAADGEEDGPANLLEQLEGLEGRDLEDRLRLMLEIVMRESQSALESRLEHGEEVPASLLSNYYSERMAKGPVTQSKVKRDSTASTPPAPGDSSETASPAKQTQ